METINKLNLKFRSGEALKSDSLNSLVTAINDVNDVVNNILKSYSTQISDFI